MDKVITMKTALLLLLGLMPILAGAVNKCVDSAGKVTYQDTACPKGAKAYEFEPVAPPTPAQIAQAQAVAAQYGNAAMQLSASAPRVHAESPSPPRLVSQQTEVPTSDPHYYPTDWNSNPWAYAPAYPLRIDGYRHHYRPIHPHADLRAPHLRRVGDNRPATGSRPKAVNLNR
jgi:hypothetical protein